MTLIAEQTVLARAVSPLSLGKASTGTPCVTVSCKLKEGPDEGRLIDYVGWLSDAAKARTAEALSAFGFDGETPASVQKNDVRLVIRHESYKDEKSGEERTTARVAFVNDPSRGGARFDVLEPHEEARLMGDLKGLVFALREKKPQPGSGTDFDFGANVKTEGKVVF